MASENNSARATGFYHLPLRMRDSKTGDETIIKRSSLDAGRDVPTRRVPESLRLTSSSLRLRSPTESTVSSVSSANIPDSATIHTISTLASPVSTSYASDVQEFFSFHDVDISKAAGRVSHRHQPSSGTCSTFVNEEDDGAIATGYPDLDLKIRELPEPRPATEIHDVSPPPDRSSSHPAVKEEEGIRPTGSSDLRDAEPRDDRTAQDWENASTTSSSEDLSGEDGDSILDYTLQLVYGLELREAPISPIVARTLVSNFVRDIGQNLCQTNGDSQLTHTMSVSSSSSTPSQGSSGGEGNGGKRKKPVRRDDDGDEFSDGEGSGFLGVKRARPNPKEDENLRLSCPFRKRNPHRFNVRDHHSCAMTYFPKFAELRQHIVKQHKRDDPSAFVCDRCNRNFSARKELRDHQRLPKELMCDISDHDPESGIDGPTATKLLSRKRASGSSPQVQWNEIWHILFPDDEDHDVKPFEFTPVIEHFELSASYLEAFRHLQISLRDKISNPNTLETLATKFHQCFIETLGRCIDDARRMPYTNRSNKKNEVLRQQTTRAFIPRKGREILPRPDSGVVMDDGSEESGSVMDSSLTHRNSMRTIKGGSRRGSSQIPEAVPEVVPPHMAPGSFDASFDDLMLPTDTMDHTMNLVAVQAWQNNVFYPQVGDGNMGFSNYESTQPETVTLQPNYLDWGATNLNNMGNGFNGFNNQ